MRDDIAARRLSPLRIASEHDPVGLLLGWQLAQATSERRVGFHPPTLHTQVQSATREEALWFAREGHLLTIAPTGSGKGTGCIIPTLLHYPGPVVVVDPKGEAFRVTSRWRRQRGHHVVCLDPFGVATDGAATDGLNPFDLLTLPSMQPEDEARTLAELVSGGRQSLKDPFWDNVSQSLISGLCAWLATSVPPEERRLSRIRDLFGADDFAYNVAVLLDSNTIKSADAKQEFAIFLQHPERETRPSVQSTAAQHFRHFGSEAVRRATDRSTLSLNDVVAGKLMSIYIIVPPAKLDSHHNLLRLWLGALLLALSTRKQQPAFRTLFIIDEAAQLGRLSALQNAITLYRSFGVSVWSCWQDASQLRQLYPDSWQTIVNNCTAIQLFGPRNQRMAEEFAQLVGGVSPEQVMRLTPDQQVLLLNGGAPIICRRPNYLTDALFRGRFDPNPMYGDHGEERTVDANEARFLRQEHALSV